MTIPKLSYQTSTFSRFKADAVAVFVSQDDVSFKKSLGMLRALFGKWLDRIVELEGFKGKEGEVIALVTDKKFKSPRLLLVGLGEENKRTLETYRRAAATAAKKARSLKLKHLALSVPIPSGNMKSPELVEALAEGAVLSLYKFDKYLTEKDGKENSITDVTILGEDAQVEKDAKKILNKTKIVCEAVYLARDLENAPGNEIYPETLAAAAQQSAKKYGYRCEVWDKKRIETTGFGGLLAVNSGSVRPPRFIILEHNGGRKDLATVVLIGKGITFDSGGISIKPAANMAEMKMDMAGAAAVIGTMEAAVRLKLPLHLVGLIPTTENMPSGSSMRPGDIIRHYGGKTSEVDNTDAEGRLILADALAYAEKYKPNAVIDLATLTGAVVVALGQHATGMFGNNDELIAKLKEAGDKTYERVWQMPLFDEYEKQIKSDVADVKNVGGRWAGAITAALFLKKFIGKYKWVHLDIAGTAMLEEDLPYAPKGGSGVGVRLLIEMLKNWK
jgi:leucyl aminopeptidase